MLRIYYTSDIHGSDICFKKFINAAAFYKADVLILGGDITGKVVVPIIKTDDQYKTRLFNSIELAETQQELIELKKRIKSNGYYYYLCDQEKYHYLENNEDEKSKIFKAQIMKSITEWLEIAHNKLNKNETQCFIMLGNDDDPTINDILSNDPFIINPENEIINLNDDFEMISLGYSNVTPFNSPREVNEDKLKKMICELMKRSRNSSSSIFNFHVPPYNSGLDNAPELDNNLRIKSYSGQPKYIPVGSTAVMEAIKKYNPLLGLHGHVHESAGIKKIGKTLCINPGSAYASGVLKGVIINLENKKIVSHQFVSG